MDSKTDSFCSQSLIELLSMRDTVDGIVLPRYDKLRQEMLEKILETSADCTVYYSLDWYKSYLKLVISGIWKVKSQTTMLLRCFGYDQNLTCKDFLARQLLPCWQTEPAFHNRSLLLLCFFLYHNPSRVELSKPITDCTEVAYVKSLFDVTLYSYTSKVFPFQLFKYLESVGEL